MIHHDSCPLCSSSNISSHLRCSDYLVTKTDFDLFRCSDCGFIFTQDHPEENLIGKYYESDDYISHDDKAKGFVNRVYKLVRDIMLRRKLIIVENATGLSKGNILDIGCGTGYFAGTMKKAGWNVTGIEPNNKARDFSISRFKINAIDPGQISSLPDKSFDCITLWHVLEHFHDPYTYFAEINRLLKPGGICVTALPNSDSSDAEYFKRYWAAYDVPRHLWHFGPSSFKTFSEKNRFRIRTILNLPFDVFYISALSEKNRGSRFHFIKGMLHGIGFSAVSLQKRLKSSSLIYILHRADD